MPYTGPSTDVHRVHPQKPMAERARMGGVGLSAAPLSSQLAAVERPLLQSPPATPEPWQETVAARCRERASALGLTLPRRLEVDWRKGPPRGAARPPATMVLSTELGPGALERAALRVLFLLAEPAGLSPDERLRRASDFAERATRWWAPW